MTEYLSKEEIKHWRSSLERITLEEYARRLGKSVKGEKQTNDIVDLVLNNSSSKYITDAKETKPAKEAVIEVARKSVEMEQNKMYKEVSKQLMSFIQQSPTAFHAVDTMKKILNQNGYQELSESQKWTIQLGGKYYVTRNQSSLIAFHVGQHLENYNFHIVASHSDSPTFKLKENAEVEIKNHYVTLNTEGYGGMICASWLDRPLSIAGRVMVKDNNTYQTRLLCFDQDLVLIPNVAIHMNRSVNDGYAYNKQIDMLPLIGGQAYQSGDLKKMIAKELQVDVEDIYGSDLYLYNRMQPTIWGAHDEFISSPRLDDLQCAYTSLQGFLKGHHSQTIQVFACFDNEEVGSSTKQGAASTFLYDTLYSVSPCNCISGLISSITLTCRL